KWYSCTKKMVTKECGKDAYESFSEFVGESFGTLTKMVCPHDLFATRTELCKELLPKEGTVAKGQIGDNALTKYVTSMFSFLFVFIDSAIAGCARHGCSPDTCQLRRNTKHTTTSRHSQT